MRRHQPPLILAQLLNRSANISLFHPPGEKVPHHRVASLPFQPLLSLSPLLIEAPVGSIRRRLHHQLASGSQRGPQPCQRSHPHLPAIGSPRCSADTASSIRVPRSHPPRSPRETRCPAPENTSARHWPCSAAAALPQLLRQTLPEPLHNPEDSLRCLPRLRHLHRQHPRAVIVFRKNRPATQVVMPICRAFSTIFCRPHPFFKSPLHRIGSQRPLNTLPVTYPKQLLRRLTSTFPVALPLICQARRNCFASHLASSIT